MSEESAGSVESSSPDSTASESSAPEAASQETAPQTLEGALNDAGTSELEGAEPDVEGDAEPEVEAEAEQLYTIKIDGVESQISKDELLRGYQTAKAAHDRFQEAAKLREQVDSHFELFGKDPIQAAIKAAEAKGITADQFREATEQWLWENIQREQMSPEEREKAELQEKVKQYEEAQKKAKEEEQQQTINAQVAKARDKYASEMSEAIDANGLSADPRAVQQVAQIMLNSVDGSGMPTLSVKDAVAYYKQEQSSALNDFLSKADINQLTKLLGEEKLNQLRKQDLAKLKNPISSKAGKAEIEKILDNKPAQKRSASDFFDNL